MNRLRIPADDIELVRSESIRRPVASAPFCRALCWLVGPDRIARRVAGPALRLRRAARSPPGPHGPDLAAASGREPPGEPGAGMGAVVASGSGLVAPGRRRRGSGRDRERSGWDGLRCARGRESRLWAVRQHGRADRRRSRGQHEADGGHHHHGGRTRRRFGSGRVLQRRPPRGAVRAFRAGRRDDDPRRCAALGALHAPCLGVGADRIPHRRGRQHHPRPARRPPRLPADGQAGSGQGLERDHTPERHVADRSSRWSLGAGVDDRAESHPDRFGRVAWWRWRSRQC